jgi:hypothetical protein
MKSGRWFLRAQPASLPRRHRLAGGAGVGPDCQLWFCLGRPLFHHRKQSHPFAQEYTRDVLFQDRRGVPSRRFSQFPSDAQCGVCRSSFNWAAKPLPNRGFSTLANVLGHAVAALLVFSTAALLFLPAGEGPARWAALFAGAAFAVHPAVSEVVCWAKSLDDILAAIFVLAAAREVLLWRGEKKRLVAALAFFALADVREGIGGAVCGAGLFSLARLPQIALEALRDADRALSAGGRNLHGPPQPWSWGKRRNARRSPALMARRLLDTIPAVTIYFRLLWGFRPFRLITRI